MSRMGIEGATKFGRRTRPACDGASDTEPPACPATYPSAASEASDPRLLLWDEDGRVAANFVALGEKLAVCGDLFRRPGYGGGLLLLLADGHHASITTGPDLAPIVVDRVDVTVIKDGKAKGGKIDQAHLNAMLKDEAFLGCFHPVDRVSTTATYLGDYTPTTPGYNDGGKGHRILYVGETPEVSDSLGTIEAFLDVMSFETNADKTNAVAAALTVLLRNHWPGGKPVVVVTATKSHAGKDTVIAFAAGEARSVSISYQATNWALERSFVGAVGHDPETGVVVIENARLDRRDTMISSAFLERFATDPEPLLFSTGTGKPVRRHNDLVLAISTNFGSISEDLMNRSLPIRLNPIGDLAERRPTIGNPKLEYLPAKRGRIAAELRGMVERWRVAGMPHDEEVRHPSSVWAGVIGGILRTSGFQDFLTNYGQRRVADDPLKQGLGILGASKPDSWLPPADWANLAVDLGLTKAIIPSGDRDSPAGRQRGIGVVLSAHRDETFVREDDACHHLMKLEKKRGRWGGEPEVRYRFTTVERRVDVDTQFGCEG